MKPLPQVRGMAGTWTIPTAVAIVAYMLVLQWIASPPDSRGALTMRTVLESSLVLHLPVLAVILLAVGLLRPSDSTPMDELQLGSMYRHTFPLALGVGWVAFLVMAGLAAMIMEAFLYFGLNYPSEPDLLDNLGKSPKPVIAVFIFLITGFLPIVEELAYRVVLFDALRRMFPYWGAALVAGLFFGLLHEDLLFLPVYVVFSLILQECRRRTGSIYLSMLTHVCLNSIMVVLSLSQQVAG